MNIHIKIFASIHFNSLQNIRFEHKTNLKAEIFASAWTWTAAWTWTCGMDMDMQYEHLAWTWTSSMDMDLQHGY
jgi:hypothetical protein